MEYIDSHEHETWVMVGMCLRDQFGDDGWPLFDEWSRSAENYNQKENHTRWKSFKPGGGRSIASVYRMARDNGWRDDGTYRIPNVEELTRRKKDRADFDADEKRKRDQVAAETAKLAVAIWSMAEPLKADNPYFARKDIPPNETLREIDAVKAAPVLGYSPGVKGEQLQGRCLVVPTNRDGILSNLQLIDGAGRKYFLPGSGTIRGGFWAAQPLPDGDGAGIMLVIGEGVATVLSVRQAVPLALGVAAMMNSNIPAVVRQMRERYPNADIVLLADIDKKTGEPDTYAVEAAEAVGGGLAAPSFADGPAPERKDFNDMSRVHGVDDVRKIIEAAQSPRSSAASASQTPQEPKMKVELLRGSTIEPEPISWIMEGHLARGKVHILGGKPAAGKTTLAISIAAIVTTGGTLPDGSQCQPGQVVIWSGEDDPKDTLVPRLIAAGADLDRVHFVSGAIENDETIPFDPAKHMCGLAEALEGLQDVALLIVDPIVSAVAGDSYKNAEVRRALQPLADLAAKSNCAVLGITHFTKGTGGRDPVERLTGSLAFGAVARIVLLAANVEDDDSEAEGTNSESGRRLMTRAKSNIGPDGGGFEYTLEQRELPEHPGISASVVKWGRAVEGSARELLAEAEATDGESRDSVSDAMDWLSDLLAKGPVKMPKIKTEAKGAGHSWATVRRAKKRLGIVSQKRGMKGGWVWEHSGRRSQKPEDAPSEMESTFDGFEHLRLQDSSDEVVEGTL
jgi:putative DNA primase/helicase